MQFFILVLVLSFVSISFIFTWSFMFISSFFFLCHRWMTTTKPNEKRRFNSFDINVIRSDFVYLFFFLTHQLVCVISFHFGFILKVGNEKMNEKRRQRKWNEKFHGMKNGFWFCCCQFFNNRTTRKWIEWQNDTWRKEERHNKKKKVKQCKRPRKWKKWKKKQISDKNLCALVNCISFFRIGCSLVACVYSFLSSVDNVDVVVYFLSKANSNRFLSFLLLVEHGKRDRIGHVFVQFCTMKHNCYYYYSLRRSTE